MRMRAGIAGVVALCGLTATGALAEQELGDVYPMGGCVDSEFEVEVGCTFKDPSSAVFSGEGVKAKLIGPVKEIRVNAKKGKAVEKPVPNRFRFAVTIDKDALPGVRSFRVGSAARLSEPIGFEVGTMPEVGVAATNRLEAPQTVLAERPVCVNGRVFGTETNRYVFQAKKGATWVAFSDGSALPGRAPHPAVSFATADGKPCEGVVAYGGAAAPVAVFEVPQDGAYALNVAGVSESGKAAPRTASSWANCRWSRTSRRAGRKQARTSTFSCPGLI